MNANVVVGRERHEEAVREVTILLDLAISHSRASRLLDGRSKDLIRQSPEAAKQELSCLEDRASVSVADEPDRLARARRSAVPRSSSVGRNAKEVR